MKLYHGSLIEHLAISNSGTGLGYNFGAVFFARTWEAQAMRIAFARKLGFKAVGMDDECGSIAVLPEFLTSSPALKGEALRRAG